MNRQTFAWGGFKARLRQKDIWLEGLYVLGLLLAAALLFLNNLGSLPLRDWDEGTVAQVAKEVASSPKNSLVWLFPTLWGQPYLNKPPLVHNAIAIVYSLSGGINEFNTRLPGALFSTISVPLLYCLAREIFINRRSAFFSALIYLTLMPVVRHGRLAMLDGALLCFEILTVWAILRSRRDLRWTLGAGIGLGLICLTKGIVGLLIASIFILFLAWDTPRLLNSQYFWGGLFLGSLPALIWHLAQLIYYRASFIETNLLDQSLHRIWNAVEGHAAPPWYYLLELLKYAWPWLLPCISGLKLAFDNRNWSWAKLVLVWSGVYFVAISLMNTKLPWYIMPVYPALALAGGAQLNELLNVPSRTPIPRFWTTSLVLLGSLVSFGCVYFAVFAPERPWLILILASLALTCGIAALLIQQRDKQFIAILFWGMYVSILLFVSSPDWLWELNEAYPVKPVAAAIKKHVPVKEKVYTNFSYHRPSLDFYSDRQVQPANLEELKKIWHRSSHPYFLIDKSSLPSLQLLSVKRLDSVENWLLVTKNAKTIQLKNQQ
jgi:4-amino-4-deoxy-L-arabinose transferase-like glycosyltransferase